MRPRMSQIEHGSADGINTEIHQLGPDQPCVEAYGFEGCIEIGGGKLAEAGSRWGCSPLRRTQTLDPPTLLIDEHRRVFPAHRVAKLGNQPPNRPGFSDIASEENESERFDAGKKTALFVAQP